VVRLIADGLTNREAAERLFVSPHVASHLRHAFTKLDVKSRVELTRLVSAQAGSLDKGPAITSDQVTAPAARITNG
jgi:DNA-binding NarL/FixJ family response regulator